MSEDLAVNRWAHVAIVVGIVCFLLGAGGAAVVTLSSGDRVESAQTAPASVRLTMAALPGDLIQVIATIETSNGASHSVRLQMNDGDAAVVALPGHPAARYRFNRRGGRVTATPLA